MNGGSEAPAVVVRELTRAFGEFVAVDRVSFTVARGEIFGFLGPNGAGKSTTIRMLCGLLSPTSGEGTVAGFDLRTGAETIKKHIGYMSQRFSLYDDLTVEENIDFFAGIYGVPADRKGERKDRVLRMAGLLERRASRTAYLPAGWKQRLALGCAILHDPPVLFLDEPTAGVDPLRRRAFWELIHEMAETGTTVFVTTHYMDEASSCDRLGLIDGGKIVALGTPEELRNRFMKGAVLEVRTSRPEDAAVLLETFPGVRSAALFGNTVHAVVDDPGAAASVASLLSTGGLADATVVPITPSLEDVFVSLVEGGRPDGVPGGEGTE